MKEKIIIADTTIREAAHGNRLQAEEKLQVALLLESLGVDIIEVNFPKSMESELEVIHKVAKTVKDSTICGLASVKSKEIRLLAKALKPAEKKRIHTFFTVNMRCQKRLLEEEVLDIIKKSVKLSRHLCPEVQWSACDAFRADPDFLCQCVDLAINCGATTINLADSFARATTEQVYNRFQDLIKRVPNIDQAILSFHTHHSGDKALEQTLAAIRGGVGQVETTINGTGRKQKTISLNDLVQTIRTNSEFSNQYSTSIETISQDERVDQILAFVKKAA